MVQTAKELLHDAVTYDEPYLAHAIFYAVQKGFVTLEEPASSIPYEKLDHQVILKMREENMLAMCNIKLFIIPMGNKRFALYLAKKVEEARAEHHRIYGGFVEKVIDISDKMDSSTYCETTRKWQSFRELKKQVLQFPYFAGEMSS